MEPARVVSPFDLDQPDAYRAWRDERLARYPGTVDDLVVEVRDPRQLSAAEHQALLERCQRCNMAIYAGPPGPDKTTDKTQVRELGRQFGLERLDHNPGADEDAISSISVQLDAYHREYIPYTNRPIAWHTDGYYNAPDRQIQGMLLHCVQPAQAGGENELLDHELLYIWLRERDPDYVRALMHPEAMLIPANQDADGQESRPARIGPVFSIQPEGHLHMRYTDRTRSIRWRDDPLTREAVACLKELLHTPTPLHFRARLAPGQGLICNNVPHTRGGFDDGPAPRLLYRARYYDRLGGT